MNFAKPIRAALFLAISTVLVGVAQGHAQESDNDLRRKNQQLTTQVQDLRAELEALRRENESLKQRITQLEQAVLTARRAPGRAVQQTQPEEPERVTIDETLPGASPRALFRAVQESYDRAMANMD